MAAVKGLSKEGGKTADDTETRSVGGGDATSPAKTEPLDEKDERFQRQEKHGDEGRIRTSSELNQDQ